MKNFMSLRLIDKFSFIYSMMGINYEVMRKILQVKLTMDGRRVPTIMTNDLKEEKENSFKKSLLMYGLIGLGAMAVIIPDFPLFFKMNIIYAIILFMVMTTMISDFSSVLLDIREKNILLSKPIDARTMNTAKATHILIYLFSITIAIAGPALIAGSFKYGILFGMVFFIQLILVSGFVIWVTSLLYFVILFIFDGEKLKDIINYFQITLSIIMAFAYQFVGRIFAVLDLNIVFTPKWWSYLIPSVWFSAPYGILIDKSYDAHYINFTIMGILVPILGIIAYFKVVAPYFEKSLLKLNNNSSKQNKVAEAKGRRHKKIANIFCFKPTENIFFRFTQNMVSNERNLKLRLYPSLVIAAIVPLSFIVVNFDKSRSFAESLAEISAGKGYFSIYITIGLLAMSISSIATSEKYKGAWIYKALPIKNPGSIYKGALKGFFIKFILPIYLFVSIIFLIPYGLNILLDIGIMFLTLILVIIGLFHWDEKRLPFSENFQRNKGDSLGLAITSMIFIAINATLHWNLREVPIALAIYIALLLISLLIMWIKSFKITW